MGTPHLNRVGSSSRVHIKQSDWFFFIGALVAIPVWYFTNDPLSAVIIITVIDAVAFIPTIRKAYAHPETENGWSYALSSIKFTIAICALSTFSWTTVLYPVSLVVANSIFVLMLGWRYYLRRNATV